MCQGQISVIIATYNRCNSLKDTLDCLLKQKPSLEWDYEVIVADNNSTDETRRLIDSYMSKFNEKLIYLFESRQGKSYALNTAIKKAKGSIIAFTDDDTILPDNWLYKIAGAFKKDIEFACGKVTPYFGNGFKIPYWCPEKILYRVFGCVTYGQIPRYLTDKDPGLSGMNIFVRKEIFKRVGSFGPTFYRGQDTDFYFRARQLGIKIYYLPTIVTFHKILRERLTKKHFRNYHYISGGFLGGSISEIKQIENKIYKRKILNIPYWIIKDILIEFIKCIFFILLIQPKKSFLHEMQLFYLLGTLRGVRNYAKGKCNNPDI